MRNILIILLFAISFTTRAQTDQSVDQLPDAGTPAGTATQYLYLLDGSTDKSLTLQHLYGVMDTKDNVVKNQVDTAKAHIRASIAGGGSFTRVGLNIYPTTNTWKLGLGGQIAPAYPLDVTGEGRISNQLYTPGVTYGASSTSYSGSIWGNGDDLMFQANNTTAVSLLTLLQGPFNIVSSPYTYSTVYPNNNWNFGGTTPSAYKVNVTGNLNATGNISVSTNARVYFGTSFIREVPLATNYLYFNIAGHDIASLTNTGSLDGTFFCTFFHSSQTTNPGAANLYEGTFYYNSVAHSLRVSNGTSWIDLGSGGGLSQHMTDTLYLDYVRGSVTGTRFLVPTHNGAVDTGVLHNASEQLRLKYPSIRDYMKDQEDGELAGYYTKDGKLVKNYGLKDNHTGESLGLQAIEVLQGHNERNYIFSLRNWIENKWQWVAIAFLFLWCGIQQLQINRLKRR